MRTIEERIARDLPRLRPEPTAKQAELPTAPKSLFVADEIRKLKLLLDNGVLTQAEFTAQKGKLLGSAMEAPGDR